MHIKSLSIVIPVFNEENTIIEVLDEVNSVNLINNIEKEIIIVDDCSTDNSAEIIKNYISKSNNNHCSLFCQDKNKGKGAALRRGIAESNGDCIIIQDADLEYSPKNFEDLILPIIENYADVVYGTRFSRAKAFHVYSFPHNIANYLITLITNILFNKSFSDVCTGYKVFKSECIKGISLSSLGYDFETEITAKFSKNKKLKIYEVPISIYSRNYSEGKKIHWWHFFQLLYSLIKWRIKK